MNERYPYTPDMLVSVKFYARLVERVRCILRRLHLYSLGRENAILCRVNHYIRPEAHDIPYAQADKYCDIIFQSLRDEIDGAVERSRRARALAAARRALRCEAESRNEATDRSTASPLGETLAVSHVVNPARPHSEGPPATDAG